MSEAAQSNAPAARSSRLGRSAWLAFGIGVGLGLLLAAGALLTHPNLSHDASIAFSGLGISALGICTLWALVLAVRALIAKERATLPVLLLMLVGAIPVFVVGAAMWIIKEEDRFEPLRAGWMQYLFLPVILPFVGFMAFTGAPLVLTMLWWKNKRRAQRNEAALMRRERWRFALKFGAIYVALGALILLPMPLFVMCAVWSGGMRTKIAEKMPDFVRDSAESILSRGEYSRERFDFRVLGGGYASEDHLFERMKEEKGDLAWAHIGLGRSHYPDTAGRVLSMLKNSNPQFNPSQLFILVAQLGTLEQRREALELTKTNPAGKSFLFWLRNDEIKPDGVFSADLRAHFENPKLTPESRVYALAVVVAWTPREQRGALLRGYLEGPDRALAELLVLHQNGLRDGEAIMIVGLHALKHGDAKLRELALYSIRWHGEPRQKMFVLADYLETMLGFLNDPDVATRRLAARSILLSTQNMWSTDMFKLDKHESQFAAWYQKMTPNISAFNPPASQTDENAMFESLRKKVEAKLKELKKSK